MNFALSKKYSELDFEEVCLTDLRLIGGGCGESGGGSVTVQSVQSAAQSAAAGPGANPTANATVNPSSSGQIIICFQYSHGGIVSGCGDLGTDGHITASSSSNGSGGFWASVSSFFSWLFGSH